MTNEKSCVATLDITDSHAVNDQALSNAAFGRRLRELRTNSGITRAQMAETLGMETNSLGLIERGINGMSKNNIITLNTVYGFDLNYLLTGNYFAVVNALKDVRVSEWLNIFNSCPGDKIDALISITKQIAEHFR